MVKFSLLEKLGRRKQALVISETDIDAALAHLRALPYQPQFPMSWDRQQLLVQLREAIGNSPKINECHDIGPGIFAIIKPFGIDLVGKPDGRLQVWLFIRSSGTDPTRVTTLG